MNVTIFSSFFEKLRKNTGEPRLFAVNITEPGSNKNYKLACAHIEASDQPARPRSLIRIFDGRSLGRQGSISSSGGKLRH